MLGHTLLSHKLVRTILPIRLGVEAQVPWHKAGTSRYSGLRIHDAVASLRGLDKLGVLFLEEIVVLFRFPVPGGVGSEDEIHFFQSALVGLGVECPDDDDGEDVDGAEDVEGFFVKFGKHGGEEENLGKGEVVSGM